MVATGRWAGDGMEMKEVIPKQPGKAGNIAVVEEAEIMTMKTNINDLQVVAVVVHVVAKGEVGTEMRKDIPKQPGKAGNIARAGEAVVMMKMRTTIKDLHLVAVEGAVIMMKKMTTISLRAAVVEGVAITMKMMTTIEHRRVAAAVDMKMKTTSIKARQVAVVEVRGAVRVEVGMAMKKDIQSPPGKVGSIAAEEEAVVAMMMMAIIKGLHVVAAEVHAVRKAEDGSAMKKGTRAPPGKDGEIAINFLNSNFQRRHITQPG